MISKKKKNYYSIVRSPTKKSINFIRFFGFFFVSVCSGKEVGETVMYYGCRHRNEDYLYQEELEEAEKNGVLQQLNVAFSRDQEQKVQSSLLMVPDPSGSV